MPKLRKITKINRIKRELEILRGSTELKESQQFITHKLRLSKINSHPFLAISEQQLKSKTINPITRMPNTSKKRLKEKDSKNNQKERKCFEKEKSYHAEMKIHLLRNSENSGKISLNKKWPLELVLMNK